MNRRQFLAASAAALAPAAPAPNILVLLSDDQRWDTLGCMGNRLIRTPHLDRLAARGTLFENAFVTTSICCTSRASILSGQYARAHGIHDFATDFKPGMYAKTYPQVLRAAGYRTGFIGKYGVSNRLPQDSFDYWRGFPGQGKYFPEGEPGPHLTGIMGNQALEFLSRPGAQPWCLSISWKAAHVQDEDPRQFLPSPQSGTLYEGVKFPAPKTADPKYIAMLPPSVQRSENRRRWAVRFGTDALYQESVRNYYRLISEMDNEIGRIVDRLQQSGQLNNTVIVFLGDNGFYLGEHGLAGKWFMHEESIRVPMIVFDPRGRAGQRRREMALNIDVAPTVLQAAGLPVPREMQGRSLQPLARGERPQWRSEFFYEHLLPNAWIPKTEGVRTERWKYCRFIDENPLFEELYDLQNDPQETNNLASSSPQIKVMRSKWQAWRERAAVVI